MFLPPTQTNGSQTNSIFQFGGLDLREVPPAGSLSGAENLSAADYPALRTRPPRTKVLEGKAIRGVLTPDPFTGIREGEFYYQGTRIPHSVPLIGECVLSMNGNILIFPDKLYYNTLPDPETGEPATALSSMEKTLTLSEVVFYTYEDEVSGTYTAYLQKNDGGFDRFREGECIRISGSSEPQNNTVEVESRTQFASPDSIVSAVVKSATAHRLDLLLYNKNGGKAKFVTQTEPGEISVKVSIPVMNHLTVHNNRLWGTAESGETVHASKLGDFTSFYSFQGLSDDSWYGTVATGGEFTGICGYRSSVVAFKDACLHHIYGDRPQNFSMPKQVMGGCVDGRSVTELGGVLYYLSHQGVLGYTGGEPYEVSKALPISLVSGAGGTDGRLYYLAAADREGQRHLFTYAPDKGIWQREDDTPFTGFLLAGSGFYGVCEEEIWRFHEGTEQVSWSMTTAPLTYDTLKFKGANCLRLLLDSRGKGRITVSVSYDGGAFLLCGALSSKDGLKSHRVPIRFRSCDSFQIRVEGQGDTVIRGLELSLYQGGKTYAI